MNKISLWVVLLLLGGLAIPIGLAQAHGVPTITVQPVLAAAGSQITVQGSDMEDGQEFTITLEGIQGSIPLGKATAKGEGEEATFNVDLAIPADTPPGSYSVRAVNATGEKGEADLTVTSPSNQASGASAMDQGPSSAPHPLDRSKPVGEVVGVIILAVLSAGLGFALVLAREK